MFLTTGSFGTDIKIYQKAENIFKGYTVLWSNLISLLKQQTIKARITEIKKTEIQIFKEIIQTLISYPI